VGKRSAGGFGLRPATHPNALRVQSVLEERGVTGRVLEFDETTRTSADAAKAIGTSVAQIAKSLVFVAGDEPVVVIASGVNRVSTDKVSKILNAPIGRADAALVKSATGFSIGGVPPVAHATELDILIDEDLFLYDEVWAAGGMPNAVFPTTPRELENVTGGRVANVKEEPA
jgi:prolyl-tRNA editing enzyme YbaK/EbsC (Cys-tRNA(Pro) deacylase)